MIFQITLAEKVIEVHTVYDFSYVYCLDYLTHKSVVDFVIEINSEEIENELDPRILLSEKYGTKKMRYYYGYTEFLILYRKICEKMLDCSTFLMHGAVVSDGKWGYLFSAPSGTGKTTRAVYLKNYLLGATIINGDKPLIKIEDDDTAIAFGTPWCGKEYMGKNSSIPLRAVFLLERAEKTDVRKLTIEKALPYLVRQTYFSSMEGASKKTMELLCRMAKSVNIYKYCSTDSIDDVLLAYDMARK